MGPEVAREPTRLYVGGLPHDITPEQIAQRFQSFGTVQAVQLVPEKRGSVTAGPMLKPCRGFAYVQFVPKDDAALHRCISMYNGCKWMGGILRVEPAKLHFTARIAQEKAEEIQSHQELTRANKQPTVAKPLQADKAPLTILRRDGKKTMKAQPNQVKTYFPLVKLPRSWELTWDPLEPPPGVLRRMHALLDRMVPSAAARNVASSNEAAAQVKAAAVPEQQGKGRSQKVVQPAEPPQEQRPDSSKSEELAAVDFMDTDEEKSGGTRREAPAVLRDARFDSSDDDEATAAALQPKGPAARATPAGGVPRVSAEAIAGRARAVESLERLPQHQAGRYNSSNERLSREPAHARQWTDGAEQDDGVALSGQEAVSEEDEREAGVEDDIRDSGRETGGSGADSSAVDGTSSGGSEERGSDAEEEVPMRPLAAPSDAGTLDQQSGEKRGVGIPGDEDTESKDDDSEEGDPDETEKQESSSSGEDAGISLQHGQEAGSESSSEHEETEEPSAGAKADATDDRALPEEPRSCGSGGDPVDCSEESGRGADVGEAADDAEDAAHPRGSEDILEELARVLPKGAAFCRPVRGGQLEAAWRAARESLVADYKSKRRTALKQLPANKRARFHL